MLSRFRSAFAFFFVASLWASTALAFECPRLLLPDSTTDEWIQVVETLAMEGDPEGRYFEAGLQLVPSLSESAKRRIAEAIAVHYRSASKRPLDASSNKNAASPRRALDALLSRLFTPNDLFTKDIRRINVLPRYNRYLRSIQLALGNSEHEFYSSESVLIVAKALRRGLRRQCPPPCEDKEILFFGSFPNGRARWTKSDFDLILRGYDEIGPEVIDLLDRFKEELARSPIIPEAPTYSPTRIAETMTFSPHLEKDYSTYRASLLSPITLRITPVRIELQVTEAYSTDPSSPFYRTPSSGENPWVTWTHLLAP